MNAMSFFIIMKPSLLVLKTNMGFLQTLATMGVTVGKNNIHGELRLQQCKEKGAFLVHWRSEQTFKFSLSLLK